MTRRQSCAPSLRQQPGDRPAIFPSKNAVFLVRVILLVLGLGTGRQAFAALGAEFAASETAQARVAGVRRAHEMRDYSVHETLLPSGTTVHEYVGPDQRVFAVTWQGPQLPDLRSLLGGYFVRFNTAAAEAHAAHRPVAIHQGDLVARSGGHMRAFHGCAYLPDLLPAGMTARDIN